MARTASLPVLLAAMAAVVSATAQPETLKVAEHSLTRASQATRSRLFGLVDIYRVSLYLPSNSTSIETLRAGKTPVALRIDILYDGSLPDAIPSAWKQELMPVLHADQQQSLRRAYARLTPSDWVEIGFAPAPGTTVFVSGKRILNDSGFELMAGFLDIWMGQTPVSEDLKDELLDGLR